MRRIDPRRTRLLLHGWLWLVALGLSVTGAMAASAAWRAMEAHPAPAAAVAAVAGFEAQDHFPGAALLYLEDVPAPVASGTTGTTALPPLPISATMAAALAAAEPGIVPARPFMLAGGALDQARALKCLTDAIYYEAASEPDAGQQAVAQVVLNRVRHPAFPATVCGVVYQGSDKRGCQFSFACDGAMARVPSRTGWARAARHAAAALAGYVYAPVGLATHYHTYAVTPSWNRTLVMTDAVGAHFFHRWKGYWGTAAAFTQSYRGGEPMPGPLAPIVPAVTIAAVPLPGTAPVPAANLPAYRDTSVAVAPLPASEDRLPAAPTMLDRWKDSGKPL